MKKYLLILGVFLFGIAITCNFAFSNAFTLVENFENNSYNWVEGKNSSYSLEVKNGKYFFEHFLKVNLWITWSHEIPIDDKTDFEIQTKIEKLSGIQDHGFGLCWGFKDIDNFFAFNISGDGHFQIGKMIDGTWYDIQNWKQNHAINKGNNSVNKLTIRNKNRYLRFYINDSYVFETSCSRFFGKKIAFDINNNQKIAVDYLKVSKIEKTINDSPEIIVIAPDVTRGIRIVEKNRIKVVGKAKDNDGIYKIIINGIEAKLQSEGRFFANVPLAVGENVISIKATDTKMKSASKEFTINRKAENEIIETNKPGKRLALVIGNSDYTYAGHLANTVNDARDMNSVLEKLGFTVFKYENCNQKDMKKAVDKFGRNLTNYDVGLFFYAGHGIQVGGNNYLIPIDAKLENENDTEYDTVRADRILAKMESADSKTNIIILDACRDNPFERSWRRGARGNGLAFMNAPSGTIIAYATSPGNTASDGTGKNGLYTSAILQHIQTPNITIEQMFKRVRSTIMDWSGKQQIPWESTSLRGDFYFKSK